MESVIKHVRLFLIAGTALALSAGLAFGATPPAASTGLANAAAHAGKTVPVQTGQQTLGEDEDEDADADLEDVEETEVEDAEDAGEHCATDPTLLTAEDLEAMNHGSIACWAAQQTEWPEWFSNHGAFVRCWAHQGKADAASCTEDPSASEGTLEEPTADADQLSATHGKGQGNGKGKAKGKFKHQG
jgi:hypothetical protein